MNKSLIRLAIEEDLEAIAEINSLVFNGNKDYPLMALGCVQDWWRSASSHYLFIAQTNGEVLGYITWREEGGQVRYQPVLELDQLGVHPKFQRNGLAGILIPQSMDTVIQRIIEKNVRLGPVILAIVWVYEDNEPANKVYKQFFTDGILGRRNQYGRPEVGYKKIIPVPQRVL